jgi:hypothetical protein
VNRASHRKIGLHIPFKIINKLSLPPEPLLDLRMIVDIVQDGKPVAWRGFRVGSIGPEFGERPGIVCTRDPLWLIRPSSVRVHGVSFSMITAFQQIVEALIGFYRLRERLNIPNRSW